MSYLVFARKYRPQSFEEVLGQEHVARTLRNALEGGRLAHAYLFAGPRGVGKTTMARLLAKEVNAGGDPEIARNIMAGGDVDVIEIDAASNRRVENVEPLIDAARYVPQRSPYKIFIVDEAHMLSKHAWNALLKTLEEPPPHVLFIFATTEPQKVIETVRSRCQAFDFRRIAPRDIEDKLARIVAAEAVSVEPAVLAEIAARATGGLRDAETLLDQLLSATPGGRAVTPEDLHALLGDTPLAQRRALLAHVHAGRAPEALDTAAALVDGGADPGALLRDLYGDLHAAAVAAARGEEELLPLEWCLAAAELCGRHLQLADRARAPRAALDLALLGVSRLGDVRDLEELVSRLEALGGGGGGEAPARSASSRAPEVAAPAPAATRPAAPPASRPSLKEQWQRARGGGEAPPRPEAPPARNDSLEEAGPRPQNDPARPPITESLTGEELARIKSLPRVKEVLATFRGRLEQVRRNDGEVVR